MIWSFFILILFMDCDLSDCEGEPIRGWWGTHTSFMRSLFGVLSNLVKKKDELKGSLVTLAIIAIIICLRHNPIT